MVVVEGSVHGGNVVEGSDGPIGHWTKPLMYCVGCQGD